MLGGVGVWLWGAGCWNVAAQPPPLDLGGFITPPTEINPPYDMIVVGLQEIGSSGNRDTWGAALLAHINLAHEGRWGWVSVRRFPSPLSPHLTPNPSP
jgi:hypothetical protein